MGSENTFRRPPPPPPPRSSSRSRSTSPLEQTDDERRKAPLPYLCCWRARASLDEKLRPVRRKRNTNGSGMRHCNIDGLMLSLSASSEH